VLTITDKAAEKAMAVLAIEGKDNWGIKIYVTGTGCCGPSYGLDLQEDQMPNDEIVEKNGLRVFVDKDLYKILSGMKLDYYADGNVEGFIFTGSAPSCSLGCNSCE
jgi:iron-sulfur cluster assembly accessory protein